MQLGMRLRNPKTDVWVGYVEAGRLPKLSITMVGELADALGVPLSQLLDEEISSSFDVSRIPDWDDLTPHDQAEIMQLVAMRARLNRDTRALRGRADEGSLRVADEEAGGYGEDAQEPGGGTP